MASDPSASVAASPRPRRPWAWQPKLRWFAAEIAVVVCGVLIALALNAWWGARQRNLQETALRAELSSDVVETREVVAAELERRREIADRARAVLSVMADASPGPERDSILATIGGVFVIGVWSPVNDTYEEALGSGRLALLTDPDLRLALNRYRSSLDKIGSYTGLITTQYYQELEPFMVEHTVYSEVGSSWNRYGLVQGAPFATDFDALVESQELWNLLTLRLEWEVVLQRDLPRLDSLAQDVLRRLAPRR